MFNTLPFWAYIFVTLGLTHITILSVTIYLHRHQAHRALDLHPAIAHFFRFWLWLTTGMNTKGWVATHRKHHAKVETEEDPHSPQTTGINKVLWQGAELYRLQANNPETLEKYGHETPDDWLEQHIYSKHEFIGIFSMLSINVLLFGAIGITIWAVQMLWIPFFAAGVINGVGHWWGYRNYESADASTNISPVGILIGGEELHNNHHAFASSARFANKWYEFDVGWLWILSMHRLGLARVKKLAPRLTFDVKKQGMDIETVKAVLSNRVNVMADYAREVVHNVYKQEKLKANKHKRRILRKGKRFMVRHETLLDSKAQQRLEQTLAESHALRVVHEFSQRLEQVWKEKTASQEVLLHALQEWCRQAEATGIEALEEFARRVRGYTLQPAVVR